MKFTGIIPARYASTRFPGKPLALILGKPMIRHVYESAVKTGILDDVCIATDDERIYRVAADFGAKVYMTSTEHRSGSERCGEITETLIKQGKLSDDDVVVNIQGDEPFVSTSQLESIISVFHKPQVGIATLLMRIHETEDLINPNKVKAVTGHNKRILYFSRSPIPFIRDLPREQWVDNAIFYKHIGIYAYRAATLLDLVQLPEGILEKQESLEQLRWLENGYEIFAEVTEHENLSVDTPGDLDRLNKSFGENKILP